MSMHAQIAKEISDKVTENDNEEEESVPSNVERVEGESVGPESSIIVLAKSAVWCTLVLVFIIPFAISTAIFFLTNKSSSSCVRVLEEEKFVDIGEFITTFPLFIGMLTPCLLLGELLYQRWSDTKFQKEGESVKGQVSDRRTCITTSTTDKGTRSARHIELTVKYPAEGTSLISPSCSHFVKKKFETTSGAYNKYHIDSEIEVLRMVASDGYDPRKAILVPSITTNRMFYCKLFALLCFGVIWNFVWALFACISYYCAWPLAISISVLFLGEKTIFCCRGRIFKGTGLEGDILDRYEHQGADTDTSGSDIDELPTIV